MTKRERGKRKFRVLALISDDLVSIQITMSELAVHLETEDRLVDIHRHLHAPHCYIHYPSVKRSDSPDTAYRNHMTN